MTKRELEDENDKLKRIVRFMYLTLGYYGTLYNYDEGKWCGGVLQDRGHSARQASIVAKMDFTAEEICSWPGPRDGVFDRSWDQAKEVKKEDKNG